MKTVALIPIKLGSKRVPGKNIKPFFDGTPLMHFIQRACLDAKTIDNHMFGFKWNKLYLGCSGRATSPMELWNRNDGCFVY